MKRAGKCILIPAVLTGLATSAWAQAQRDSLALMQTFVAALGVQCQFCHTGGVGRGGGRAEQAQAPAEQMPLQSPSHMEIARNMMKMVDDLNTRIIPSATGKEASANAKIQWVTCHRGVAIPGQLSDIMTQTAVKQGGEAAVAEYRDLRKQYYGRQAYDFGEDTLITAAGTIAASRPEDAIALLKLNLEFYPQSVNTYTRLAYAYTRKLDDASAISALEKALGINPDNSVLRGQLEQLRSYHRKR
jgi:tetratricopeptide (TPR) repeat protein